jgi:hypothetical protein
MSTRSAKDSGCAIWLGYAFMPGRQARGPRPGRPPALFAVVDPEIAAAGDIAHAELAERPWVARAGPRIVRKRGTCPPTEASRLLVISRSRSDHAGLRRNRVLAHRPRSTRSRDLLQLITSRRRRVALYVGLAYCCRADPAWSVRSLPAATEVENVSVQVEIPTTAIIGKVPRAGDHVIPRELHTHPCEAICRD